MGKREVVHEWNDGGLYWSRTLTFPEFFRVREFEGLEDYWPLDEGEDGESRPREPSPDLNKTVLHEWSREHLRPMPQAERARADRWVEALVDKGEVEHEWACYDGDEEVEDIEFPFAEWGFDFRLEKVEKPEVTLTAGIPVVHYIAVYRVLPRMWNEHGRSSALPPTRAA